MTLYSTRRAFLACGGGTLLVGLGGCLSGFGGDDTVSVKINVINNTAEKLQPLVHMIGQSDEVGPQDTQGEYSLIPKAAKVISLNVPRATYRLQVRIDDPRLVEREAAWEVTDNECTHRSWVLISGEDPERAVDLLVDDCSQT